VGGSFLSVDVIACSLDPLACVSRVAGQIAIGQPDQDAVSIFRMEERLATRRILPQRPDALPLRE
jgi:hypothetical protein